MKRAATTQAFDDGNDGNDDDDGFDPAELELAIKLSIELSNNNAEKQAPPLNEWRVLVNRLEHNAGGSGGNDTKNTSSTTTTTTFDELIQLPNGTYPRRALVTSFNEDLQWILGKFRVWKGGCELTVVTSEPTPTPLRVHKNVRLYGPPLGSGHSIMHAKLMVLRFPDRARIVVSTNNANGFEWAGIGLACWVVDLPLCAPGTPREEEEEEAMKRGEGAVLHDFIVRRLGWGDAGEEILRGIDFSHMAGAAFVPSWPGTLRPGEACGGLPALRAKAFALVPDLAEKCGAVTFFASSLGSITRAFLSQFPCCDDRSGPQIHPEVAVCYHTTGDVRKANSAGLEGEGLLCFNAQFARSPRFCREVLHRVVWKDAGRAPALSHVKLIVWADRDGAPLLVYVGSHNLSGSAWGFSRGGSGSVQMNNYELGVLLKGVPADAIPFVLPAPPYVAGSDAPWTMTFD